MGLKRSQSWIAGLALNVAVALAYFVAGKLGLMLAIPPGFATVVWPPSGIALAAVLLAGYRVCPGVVAGSFLVNVATAFDASTLASTLQSLGIAVSIGAGAAGQAAVGAALVRRFVGFPNRFTQLSVLAKSLLLAGPVSCLVGATVGVSTLAAHGLVTADSFFGNWLTWWCGDSIGVLMVLPVLQSMSGPQRTGLTSRTLIVSIPLVLATILTIGLHLHFRQQDEHRVQMEFVRRAVVLENALSHRMQFVTEAARTMSVEDVRRHVETALDGRPRDGCLVRLQDTTNPASPIPLYSSRGADLTDVARNTETPGTRHVAVLEMAGRKWTFEAAMEPSFLAEHLSLQAWTFLAGGLVLTSLIGLFMLVVTAQNLAVAELVEQRTRELRSANDRAEQSNRSKSEFLANMSHEIRTPMTAILGFADLLRDSLTQPDQVEAVQTIHRNGHFLLGLINDILDLSKIESGRVELESLPCSPAQILADVVSLMRGRAADKQLTLRVESEGPIPRQFSSDPTRLRQILINLVSNAIKFTETGSVRVVVRTLDRHAAAPRLQIAVSDTGIGMSTEQRQRLFQPFTQADASMTRKFGGTGLGLTISKRLVEMLGGTLDVASRLGQGTTFTIAVPIGSPDAVEWCGLPPESVAPAQPVTPAPGRSSVTTPPVASLQHCRVLVAEDVPANQRLISFFLGKAGADVTVVMNGHLAVEHALSAVAADMPFDVILMDMQMPVMDGYSAASHLRQRGYNRPIIALTAHAMSGDRDKCLAAGCSDFATKPINRQALLCKVAEHFQSEHVRSDPAQSGCDTAMDVWASLPEMQHSIR